jgi:hypothetical protein
MNSVKLKELWARDKTYQIKCQIFFGSVIMCREAPKSSYVLLKVHLLGLLTAGKSLVGGQTGVFREPDNSGP